MNLVLVEGSTISPHTCEYEESFVDNLDRFLIIVLAELLEVVILLFISVELYVKLINNRSKTLDAGHVTSWSNVGLVPQVIREGIREILGVGKGEDVLR